jgi:hypothetical protein
MMSAMQAIVFRNGKQHFGQQPAGQVSTGASCFLDQNFKALHALRRLRRHNPSQMRKFGQLRSSDSRIIVLQLYNSYDMDANFKYYECFVCASQVPRECLTRRSLPSPRLEAHSALPPCLHQVAFSNTTLPAVIPLSLRQFSFHTAVLPALLSNS